MCIAHIRQLRDALLGQDPTNVERVMQRIRRQGRSQALGQRGQRHRNPRCGIRQELIEVWERPGFFG
jgi:hypothetical protein